MENRIDVKLRLHILQTRIEVKFNREHFLHFKMSGEGFSHSPGDVIGNFIGEGFSPARDHQLDKHQHRGVDLTVETEAVNGQTVRCEHPENIAE